MASSQASQPQQKLPVGLAGVLNNPVEENRDSAYYSQHDPASKHNSTQSSHGAPTLDPLLARGDSSSITDNTPSPISNGPSTQPLNSPASGAMSVASIVSPTSGSYGFSGFYEPGAQNVGLSANGDSRRESVDSRLGTNFGDMRLAGSPYASNNQSTTSLQSTLAQQRNPGSAHPDRNSGPFRLSNGYQPTYSRLPDSAGNLTSPLTASRTAPLITGPALGAIARAPEPTKGQAWAFPEEDHRLPSARPTEEGPNRQGTSFYDDSRRNSLAESIASSQYTTESRLPPGQRRLEDGLPGEFQSRASTNSGEYGMSTHHHSLVHRQVGELQNGDTGSPTNSQPYSRTPELRVSHKLAERKRRMEMKDLFDTLRNTQGVERGAKASKWEILTKAISEHERQTKVIEDQKRQIQRLEAHLQRLEHDHEHTRREAHGLRMENGQLRAELTSASTSAHREAHGLRMENGQLRSELANVSNAPPANSFHIPSAPSAPQSHFPGVQTEQLPPLRNISGPESMNGIQYNNDTHPSTFQSRPQF